MSTAAQHERVLWNVVRAAAERVFARIGTERRADATSAAWVVPGFTGPTIEDIAPRGGQRVRARVELGGGALDAIEYVRFDGTGESTADALADLGRVLCRVLGERAQADAAAIALARQAVERARIEVARAERADCVRLALVGAAERVEAVYEVRREGLVAGAIRSLGYVSGSARVLVGVDDPTVRRLLDCVTAVLGDGVPREVLL